MSKRVASVRWHHSPIQKHTQMHTLLFSPYLPAYTPNHHDSDCSSRRLLPRQRWPRFHQIIQMTSSSVCVYVRVHAWLYLLSAVSIALWAVCVYVHILELTKNIKALSYNKQKVCWTTAAAHVVDWVWLVLKQTRSGTRGTSRVSFNTGPSSVVLQADELQQRTYMLLCSSRRAT